MPLILDLAFKAHNLKRWAILTLVFGFFGLSFHALAVEVRDPDQYLARSFPIAILPWEDTLHCGERQTFFRKTSYCDIKCSAFICQSQCQKADPVQNTVDLAVEDCTADSAFVYGTNNFTAPILKSDFAATGTMIQSLLGQFDFFVRPIDHIEVKSSSFAWVEVVEKGQMQNMAGQRVIFSVHPQPHSAGLEFEVTFVSAPSLLSSLALLRETHALTDYLLKRKGILNVR